MTESKAEEKDQFTKSLEQLAERAIAWSKRRWQKWSLYTKVFGGVLLFTLVYSRLIERGSFLTFVSGFATGGSFVLFWLFLSKDEFPKKVKKK